MPRLSDWSLFAALVDDGKILDLSEEERIILDLMKKGYKYLTRDVGQGERRLC